jgi:hypothetical protein
VKDIADTDTIDTVNISILFPSIPSSALRLTVARTTSGEVSKTPGTPPTLLFYAVLFAIPGAASINVPAPFKNADDKPVSDDLPESPVRHVLKVGPAVAYVPESSPETAATNKSENKKFLGSVSYSKKSLPDKVKDAKEKALQLFVEKIETEVHSLTLDLGGVVVPWEGNRELSAQRGQEGMRSSVSIASSKGSGWFKK